jgi:hypothetical protein
MHQVSQTCQIGLFLGSLESTERGDSNGTSRKANGGMEGAQTQCQGSKWAKIGTPWSGKHMGMWGEVADGAGKRVMKCEICTEIDKEGSGWERQSQ